MFKIMRKLIARQLETLDPLKRFAVVHATRDKRMNFRAWYATRAEAENAAIRLFQETEGNMYLIVETVSVVYNEAELNRKTSDVLHNDAELVRQRLEHAEAISGTSNKRRNRRRVKGE